MKSSPYISVIIPCLNSPIIGETITALNNQETNDKFEVLVIGQDRENLISVDEKIRFIPTKEPVSPAIARNIGINAACGELLLFTDADCIPAPDWISTLSRHYENEAISAVGGGVEFTSDNYWTFSDNLATFYEYLVELGAGHREQLPTLNLSVRKTIIDVVGLFDERYLLPAGEDADLTTRIYLAGHSLNFDPQARVKHMPARGDLYAVISHGYNFGRYSVKVDGRYQDQLHVNMILRHWFSTLLFSPILAGGVILRMFHLGIIDCKKWKYIPIVYLIKLAWCVGAARTLRSGSPLDLTWT